jgi:hypothetical protein
MDKKTTEQAVADPRKVILGGTGASPDLPPPNTQKIRKS